MRNPVKELLDCLHPAEAVREYHGMRYCGACGKTLRVVYATSRDGTTLKIDATIR
jgi:hypothetical protein